MIQKLMQTVLLQKRMKSMTVGYSSINLSYRSEKHTTELHKYHHNHLSKLLNSALDLSNSSECLPFRPRDVLVLPTQSHF